MKKIITFTAPKQFSIKNAVIFFYLNESWKLSGKHELRRLQQKHFRSHFGEPVNWQLGGSIQSKQTLYNTLQIRGNYDFW